MKVKTRKVQCQKKIQQTKQQMRYPKLFMRFLQIKWKQAKISEDCLIN